jgi:hypothetical protein
MMMSWVLLAMTMASAFASDGVDWENQKVIVTGLYGVVRHWSV